MILSTISLKGGAGKTTIAVNLSVELARRGNKVFLIDSDPNNQNCVTWSGCREIFPKVTTASLPDPRALRNNISSIAKENDFVIIDGTPALAEITGTIMLISDLNILPLKASTYDIWAFNGFFLPKYNDIKALKENIDCRILLNSIRSRKKINKEVNAVVKDLNIQILKSQISERTSFEASPMYGKDVKEYGDEKAALEIVNLTNECLSILENSNH